ncbi:hypothetical protein [Larkinella rosea]|uniref:Uncharacterized protein n=1 Tax=Larkinella rosea TaxID=2025312 RepID=A0A3P1BNY8_9BACT|nr:hypothetical protein [Larkinella rosea]RRB02850.1 hypothetical protein EHT25_20650 [Larkinella rosea]
MENKIRQKVAFQLMHHKGFISAFHLRQLFNDMPKDEPILSEVIYWFLIENNYRAIGKPQGMSPKEWLLSVDWQYFNDHSEEALSQKPAAGHQANGHLLFKRENRVVLFISCLCGLLIAMLLYWLWDYAPALQAIPTP